MLLLSVVFGMSYKEFLGFGILYGKSWIAKYKENKTRKYVTYLTPVVLV